MGWLQDLHVMAHSTLHRQRGGTHAERLQGYYGPQAAYYDAFRQRLLHGRLPLLRALPLPAGARVLDVGGGTGFLWELAGTRRAELDSLVVLDLCPALLEQARARVSRLGWSNVRVIEGDATLQNWHDKPFDVVVFSYCLTMIPDWFRAIDRAVELLRPGGLVGTTDFYVSRKWPDSGMRRHSAWRRFFWPCWFGWHGLSLNPDHLPYLQSRFDTVHLEESLGRVPYMGGQRAPYYVFVGRSLGRQVNASSPV